MTKRIIWENYPGHDGVCARVGNKFIARTWQFGSIDQCVVDVVGVDTRICLEPQSARIHAKKHAIEWIRQYEARGPLSVEETFKNCYESYPTLFRTRLDCIDHILFVIGNGYGWLDGACIDESPEEKSERSSPAYIKQLEAKRAEYTKSLGPDTDAWHSHVLKRALEREERGEIQRLWDDLDYRNLNDVLELEDLKKPGPFPDDGKPRIFFPVGQYSRILSIPDNVRPDWLEVCLEAALALRDRSGHSVKKGPRGGDDRGTIAQNIAAGKRVVDELLERFPQLKGHALLTK